jgi:hypothetical protein
MSIMSLQEVVRIMIEERRKALEEQQASEGPPPIRLYLFLDGLDGGNFASEALQAASIFRTLQAQNSVIVSLWVSSQRSTGIDNYFGGHNIINLDDYAKRDIGDFLTSKVPKFNESISKTHRENGKTCMQQNIKHQFSSYSRLICSQSTIGYWRNCSRDLGAISYSQGL